MKQVAMSTLSLFLAFCSSLGLVVVKQPGAANPVMPTVSHAKEAGSGYQPGSPLFAKQEARKVVNNGSVAATPATNTTGGVLPELPGTNARSAAQAWLGDVIYVILVLVVAYIWKRYKKDSDITPEEPYEGDAFTYGLFDCNGCTTDTRLCLCAFCCPFIRWAETSDKVNFLAFWSAIALLLGLHLLSAPTAGFASLVSLGVAVFFRQRLRTQFEHGPKKAKTVILDILAWCCCPLCAVAQEAREVEHCKLSSKTRGSAQQQAESNWKPGMRTN